MPGLPTNFAPQSAAYFLAHDIGVPQLGGARGFIDAEGVDSLSAFSGTGTNRKNVFSKIEIPVGDNTVITLLGLYDDDYSNTPYGATAAEIAKYGPKYALNDDLRSQASRGYNWDQYHTDFEYVGARSTLGNGWAVDNKTYTNGYFQQGKTGADPNGTRANLTSTSRARLSRTARW